MKLSFVGAALLISVLCTFAQHVCARHRHGCGGRGGHNSHHHHHHHHHSQQNDRLYQSSYIPPSQSYDSPLQAYVPPSPQGYAPPSQQTYDLSPQQPYVLYPQQPYPLPPQQPYSSPSQSYPVADTAQQASYFAAQPSGTFVPNYGYATNFVTYSSPGSVPPAPSTAQSYYAAQVQPVLATASSPQYPTGAALSPAQYPSPPLTQNASVALPQSQPASAPLVSPSTQPAVPAGSTLSTASTTSSNTTKTT